MKTDTQSGAADAAPAAPDRRSTAEPIAAAIDLGWRIAALHAMSPTSLGTPSRVSDDMLLNRRSLSAPDRLELELRAIAGVAQRVGIPFEADELGRLLALAKVGGASAANEDAFRTELARQHVEIEKKLWAADEPGGKAYELGNFLSDTWNRVVRPRVRPDAHSELLEIFGSVRVGRMKRLLDDLQARVDPVAAHTVSSHLDTWSARVAAAPLAARRQAAAGLSAAEVAEQLEPVERQAIIWRQMLTGAKEPEAWIGQEERNEVRDEFTQHVWRRYKRRLRWLVPLAVVLGGGLGYLYADNKELVTGLAGSALAVLGTLGITRATLTGALKRGLQTWGDLMWARALAAVICRKTSVLDELFPPPDAKPAAAATPAPATPAAKA